MKVNKGDCLISSKPFAYILSSKRKNNNCDNCLKNGKLRKCLGCHYVYYCDRACQRESWPFHKHECLSLKRICPKILPDAARLMARIIMRLKNGKEEKEYYAENKYRKFKDLMSHYSDIKKDSKRMEHFISLCGVLEDFLGKSELPNSAELLGIYGRICVNSFNILDTDMNPVGVGVYLGPSVLDHSCKPNAVAVFEGIDIFIRTLEDFPSFDWSQVRISYIDVLNTTKKRQSELENTYYFLCDCDKCMSPEPFASAGVCSSCMGPINLDDHGCSYCTQKLTLDFRNKLMEVSEFTALQLESMATIAYLDVSKTCLSKQESTLHPLNIQHIRTLESAFDAAVNLEYFVEAESYGLKLLPGYLHYYGDLNPLTGLLFLMLGKMQLHLGKSKSSIELLRKAESILAITHGVKHSIFKDNLRPLIARALIDINQ